MAAVTVTVTGDTTLARTAIGVTFANTAVTACKIECRTPDQGWVTILAGAAMPCPGGKCTAYDYEVPFDVPVYYRATQVTPTGTDTGTSPTITLSSYGWTWLRDPAFPSRNLRLDEVASLTEAAYAARAGVFAVIDRARPVVVASRRQSWTGELIFTTATMEQRGDVLDLLSRGQVLLLSTPGSPGAPYGTGGSWGLGNIYVHIGDVVETRLGVVTEPTRQWSLPLTRVDRPQGLDQQPQTMRWVDVKTKYPTWNDLANAGLTWNQLLESTP